MYHSIDPEKYLGFSHAKYIESDPMQYRIHGEIICYDENSPTHFHDEVELVYVIEGEGTLFVNSEPKQISPGNLFILMPYHVHSLELTTKYLKVYQVHLSLGILLFSSISRTVEKHISYSLAYGNIVARFSEKEKRAMDRHFEELFEELEDTNLLTHMVALSTVIKILLLFCRNISNSLYNDQVYDHSIPWKLMQYINVNYSSDISAKSMSAEFDIPPLKINHYIYQLTGENVGEILSQTRIRYACCILQFDQLSCSFIGKYVGYKNTPSFYRKFKEYKCMTPEEYRKSHLPPDCIYKSLNISWKILLYLFEHYAEPISEESVAKALFIAPEKVRTELLASFDTSLPDLITKIRVQYASSFLQVLDEPILKIAYLSGFSSVRTFNRCFKNLMGCTPNEYKKRVKEPYCLR